MNFWSSSLCSAFLWSCIFTQTHSAKVAWADLCVPKDEGGLGLRRLRDSAWVFAFHLIWRIFTGSSLWKSWIQAYLLRNSSFWEVKENAQGSWMWRKLLKLLDVAYQFIRFEVRNGETVFFWFDDWLKRGKLLDVTGEQGTRYLGVDRLRSVMLQLDMCGA